jgi:hypothetical protein
MMSRICALAIALQFGCLTVCGAIPINSNSTATAFDRIKEMSAPARPNKAIVAVNRQVPIEADFPLRLWPTRSGVWRPAT